MTVRRPARPFDERLLLDGDLNLPDDPDDPDDHAPGERRPAVATSSGASEHTPQEAEPV